MKVSRHQINQAKKIYRAHHAKLKEFDYGFTHFEEFIGLNQVQRVEYHFGDHSKTHIEVSALTAAKINALQASPEHIWTLLKAVTAKYAKPTDVCTDEDEWVRHPLESDMTWQSDT
jgi:hypothetical protein